MDDDHAELEKEVKIVLVSRQLYSGTHAAMRRKRKRKRSHSRLASMFIHPVERRPAR